MATTVVLDRGDLQIPKSSPIGDPVPARGTNTATFMVTGDGKSLASVKSAKQLHAQLRVFGARENDSSAYLPGSQTMRWKTTSAALWRC